MSDREPPKQPTSLAWPIIGSAICVILFVLAMVHAFFTMLTSGWGGGSSSPTMDFTLLAPVAGFVCCVIWMTVVLVRRYRQRR